ncbi:MAG TPA: 1-acyl-sn-glycerol-3-phosphate acyltransferase [Planctomycetota bacterium]
MTLFYRLVRGLLRAGLGFYYRELEIAGPGQVPSEGPLLIMANHHNGMVDAFILIAASIRPVRYIAKEPLFRIPVLGWFMRRLECIPAHRSQDPGYAKGKNEELYLAAKDAFLSGGAVGIFPEGASHTDPALAEFKHGAAKMALEAEALAGFRLGLRVQLVGIHFERTRLFRGRVLVTFSPPLGVDGYRDRFAADSRGAVAALTEELHGRLSKMVLDAESEEVARLAAMVERLLRSGGPAPGLEERFRRQKEILERYGRLKRTRPGEVEAVRRLLRRFDRMLGLVGSGPGRISADYRWPRILAYALKNTAILLIGAPVLALGIALNAAPYLAARACSLIGGDTEDHRASVGLLSAFFLFPAWYAALVVAGWKLLPPEVWIPVVAAGPFAGFISMRWLERFRRFGRETAGLWLALTGPGVRRRLMTWRREIETRLERLAQEE